MKKILCILLSLLILSNTLAYAEKYINGVGKNYPPFSFIDEKTGELTGFDVESMTWIAKTMGFKVEHRPMSWDGIVYELVTGEIDMICSGLLITEESKNLVSFSQPYLRMHNVFIADERLEIEYEDILSKNIKVGVKKGGEEAKTLAAEKNANKYPLEIIYYDNYSLIEQDLLKGKIEAALMDSAPAQDIVVRNKILEIVALHGQTDNYGVAFRKDDRALGDMINEGYKRLKADAYWKELVAKYLQ